MSRRSARWDAALPGFNCNARDLRFLGDELPVAVLWLTDRNVLVKRQTRAVAGQDFRISRDKSN
jgi:hypothetical protein